MYQLGLCGSIWVPTGSKLGQVWDLSGSRGSPRSCHEGQVGHMGVVGHWASKNVQKGFGATGFHIVVFWATGLINECLGL